MSVSPDMVDVRIVKPGEIGGDFKCDRAAFMRESNFFAQLFGDHSLPPGTVFVLAGQEVDIFDYFRDYVHGEPDDLPWISEALEVDWNYLASSFALCEALKARGFHDTLIRSLYKMVTSHDVPLSTPSPKEVAFICKAIPKGKPFRSLLADLWLLNPSIWVGSKYPAEFAEDIMERIRESAENTDCVKRCRLLREVDEYCISCPR